MMVKMLTLTSMVTVHTTTMLRRMGVSSTGYEYVDSPNNQTFQEQLIKKDSCLHGSHTIGALIGDADADMTLGMKDPSDAIWTRKLNCECRDVLFPNPRLTSTCDEMLRADAASSHHAGQGDVVLTKFRAGRSSRTSGSQLRSRDNTQPLGLQLVFRMKGARLTDNAGRTHVSHQLADDQQPHKSLRCVDGHAEGSLLLTHQQLIVGNHAGASRESRTLLRSRS